jgi:hypothetical protein
LHAQASWIGQEAVSKRLVAQLRVHFPQNELLQLFYVCKEFHLIQATPPNARVEKRNKTNLFDRLERRIDVVLAHYARNIELNRFHVLIAQ